MSNHTESHGAADGGSEALFTNAEVRDFEAADVEAGAAIGKMLSVLFIYTVIAMSLVSLWTVAVSSH